MYWRGLGLGWCMYGRAEICTCACMHPHTHTHTQQFGQFWKTIQPTLGDVKGHHPIMNFGIGRPWRIYPLVPSQMRRGLDLLNKICWAVKMGQGWIFTMTNHTLTHAIDLKNVWLFREMVLKPWNVKKRDFTMYLDLQCFQESGPMCHFNCDAVGL